MIGLIVYAAVTYGLWNTAKGQLEATTRPWIDISEIKPTGAMADNPPDGAGLMVTLRNSGHSPAIIEGWRFVFADLTYAKVEWWDRNLEKPKLCENFQSQIETVTFPVFVGIPSEKMSEGFVAKSNASAGHTGFPWQLSGCLVYYGPNGQGPYRTRFVYWVTFSNESGKITALDLKDVQVD